MRIDGTGSYATAARTPIERGHADSITIDEIEDRIREINPDLSLDGVRTASLLFAILKQGSSIQKLEWFTKYDQKFLRQGIEWLRSRGLLFTGALSAQFVLKNVPGSEDLIERITGQRMIAKAEIEAVISTTEIAITGQSTAGEEKPMDTKANGQANAVEVEETCGKSALCDKPDGHTGRCKGPQPRPAKQAAPAAKKVERMATAAKPRPVRKAQPNGQKAQAVITPALAKAAGGLFKIEYEDEDLTIRVEGIGRESFAAAVKVALGSLAGGSNG
jgi:hypothetical protein